jgi:large subunit ribosomal protein L25
MTKHLLNYDLRKLIGRKVKTLRKEGITPANIFGQNISSETVQINTKEFQKIFAQVGESGLLYLIENSGKKETPVFISDVNYHPVTGEIRHVSFHHVNLKEKVSAPVPIILTGEALAEKEKLGILVQQLDEVEIEALPTDMPENITIDITKLAAVGDSISLADLKLENNRIKVITHLETIVAKIEAFAKEEVVPSPTPEAPTENVETKSTPEPEVQDKG